MSTDPGAAWSRAAAAARLEDVDGPVIGVVGGSGGVGASTFAAVLAAVAEGVLVDLDPAAGGIDVLLGAEETPGPRWSGLRLGGGRLEPALLADGLPRWGPALFLAADRAPDAAGVRQVLDIAVRLGPVVVDLPRWPGEARAAAVDACALVVLVAGCDVRSVSAARAVLLALGPCPAAVVACRRRGLAAPTRVAELVGASLVGALPCGPPRGDAPLDPGSLPGSATRLARGILEGLDAPETSDG